MQEGKCSGNRCSGLLAGVQEAVVIAPTQGREHHCTSGGSIKSRFPMQSVKVNTSGSFKMRGVKQPQWLGIGGPGFCSGGSSVVGSHELRPCGGDGRCTSGI